MRHTFISIGCLLVSLALALPSPLLAQAPPQATPATSLGNLLWVDRSTGLLGSDLSQVAIAPDDPKQLYVAGPGFIARTTDGGISWGPSLLLFRGDLVSGQTNIVEVNPDDIELFDDSEIAAEFEEVREDTFEDLRDRYGEDAAEELILDLEDELRTQVFDRLVDEAENELSERLSEAREERLKKAGFDPDVAQTIASDPLGVYQILTLPSAPRSVYAATGSGLFRSVDRGVRWERILNVGVSGEGVVFDVAVLEQGRILIAGTDEGLKISIDGGRKFVPTIGQTIQEPVRIIQASPADDYVFAVGLRKLYRTDDNGTTWTSLTPTGFSPDEVNHLTIDAGDPDVVVAATTNGLHRSGDAGRSWIPLPTAGLPLTNIQQVLMPSGDANQLIALSDESLSFSTDGGNAWQPMESGLVGQRLTHIAQAAGQLWLASETGILQAVLASEFSVAGETMRLLQAQWKKEPTPADTLTAALIYAQLLDFPEEAWFTRSKLRVLAPVLDARLIWTRRRNELNYGTFQLDLRDTNGDGRFTIDDERSTNDLANLGRERRQVDILDPQLQWSIMVYWDLGRVLYDPLEINFAALIAQKRKARSKLGRRIIKLLMKRRMLQLRLAGLIGLSPDEELDLRLQIEELTALLDGLTGGFYTTALMSP